ncbi:MAG: DivIVA domain-containing protein [candidate division Zixibacteria bacterium]
MKITPLDIKKQEFGTRFRGYAADEVDSYLQMVAEEFEETLKKNLEFEEKVSSLEGRLSSYTKLENVLQNTLVTSQKSAEELKSSAEMKAKAITDEARVEADRLLSDARSELMNIRREIEDLKHQRDGFVVSFKSLLETQHAMLEIIRKKGEKGVDFSPIRMRSDLNDEDLERVVDEFEKELSGNDSENGNGSKSSEGEEN